MTREMEMKSWEDARGVAAEVIAVATEDRIMNYREDESGNEALDDLRSIVEIRVGGRVSEETWEAAMKLIREK